MRGNVEVVTNFLGLLHTQRNYLSVMGIHRGGAAAPSSPIRPLWQRCCARPELDGESTTAGGQGVSTVQGAGAADGGVRERVVGSAPLMPALIPRIIT